MAIEPQHVTDSPWNAPEACRDASFKSVWLSIGNAFDKSNSQGTDRKVSTSHVDWSAWGSTTPCPKQPGALPDLPPESKKDGGGEVNLVHGVPGSENVVEPRFALGELRKRSLKSLNLESGLVGVAGEVDRVHPVTSSSVIAGVLNEQNDFCKGSGLLRLLEVPSSFSGDLGDSAGNACTLVVDQAVRAVVSEDGAIAGSGMPKTRRASSRWEV